MLRMLRPTLVAAGIAAWLGATSASDALVAENGRTAVIPSWSIQSSAQQNADLQTISQPGFSTSSWRQVGQSRCTVVGCLLRSDLYDTNDLFFSDNLTRLNASDFQVPWFYRNEFRLQAGPQQHFHLITHGISSRADIYLNRNEIATSKVQSGAYGGRTYDVTSAIVSGSNALAIRVYPTDYNYDFGVGFVDWNPYPADRGMGVWRNVEIKQTGPVAMGPLLVSTTLAAPDMSRATVTLKATLQNLENARVTATAGGVLANSAGDAVASWDESVELDPLGSKTWTKTITIDKPAVWWPRQWGEQPLYETNLIVLVNGARSDAARKRFGVRTITSSLNSYNDTTFSVNGKPFQVVGAGYSSDLFLRWDSALFAAQCEYALDLGMNTLRLEGKMEHPELYDITDSLGLMVLPGWECCNKWEAWSYNDDLSVNPVPVWNESDYETANASMRHEALMLQNHPSVLGFLVGSDYWPDDNATAIYLSALRDAEWQMPIISSAAQRGYPEAIGPSGMKMAGPYEWVPPNYWFDTEPASDRYGAAFGFGSEQGSGVGTPELGSLKKFLSQADMDDLWRAPNKSLFHMSLNGSQFDNREIYNDALWQRYGAPTSLEDYLLKSQIMDYEATRSEFEAFTSLWTAERPATGLIYWMFNNAWPSLHWNVFDYYLHPAGSYFGTKLGSRVEHVAYDYVRRKIYLINRSIGTAGSRTVDWETMSLKGQSLGKGVISAQTVPNAGKVIGEVPLSGGPADVIFLRMNLRNGDGKVLSRNVYWLSNAHDQLDWNSSTWYHTPVRKYADLTSLTRLDPARVSARLSSSPKSGSGIHRNNLILENHSSVPAFFIRLNLVTKDGRDVAPVFWSDNYVTLWPGEQLALEVGHNGDSDDAVKVQVSGMNVASSEIEMADGWDENLSSHSAYPGFGVMSVVFLSTVAGLF